MDDRSSIRITANSAARGEVGLDSWEMEAWRSQFVRRPQKLLRTKLSPPRATILTAHTQEASHDPGDFSVRGFPRSPHRNCSFVWFLHGAFSAQRGCHRTESSAPH